MSKNERWNTRHEIKRSFPDSTDKAHGAGPVIYTEHGRKYIDDSEAQKPVLQPAVYARNFGKAREPDYAGSQRRGLPHERLLYS